MSNTVQRFDQTVENYVKYRPSYPEEVYTLLAHNYSFSPETILADIGSGTGFLSTLFLNHGHTVYGVEPNEVMRTAGEKILIQYKHFYSINGLAEATTLKNASIDFIIVGTAFHWFDRETTKLEFKRILKTPGFCCLVWNVRDKNNSPLLQDYENLLMKFSKDYQQSRAQEFEQTAVAEFFHPFTMHTAVFENKQHFDWEGLKGRLLSTSYCLRENDPAYKDMVDELKQIFDRHQINNRVEFLYETKLYYGQLN